MSRAQAAFIIVGTVIAAELGAVGYLVPFLLWGER